MWVIFVETFLIEHLNNIERTERSAVASACCHGIIHIGNRNNLGKRCYTRGLCMERITGAVTAFMVKEAYLLDSYIYRLVLEQLVSALDMILHKCVFFIGKPPRLIEYMLRNCELAYVMEQPGGSEYLQIVAGYTKPLTKNIRYKGDVLAVCGYNIIIVAQVMYEVKYMNSVLT